MERKAAIIRFWFVAVAVSLLGFWEPAMWFGVVPLFFMANCPCCGSCGVCDPDYAARMQVDISGMADSFGTSCSNWDGTYFLDPSSLGAANCVWADSPGVGVNCPGSIDDDRVAVIVASPAPFPVQVWLQNCYNGGAGGPDTNTFSIDTGASAPDCSAFSGLTPTFQSAGGTNCSLFSNPCCDGSAATVTVTAIA